MTSVRELFSWWRRPARRASFVPEFAAEPFTDACIDIAPTTRGVYLLYSNGRLIYLGMALSSIRGELERHRRGEYGQCTQAATGFDYEISADPERALREKLRVYMARYGGRLPQCNQAAARNSP